MEHDFARDELLSVPQAARELGISQRRMSKLCHDGRLGKRFGGKVYLISRRELTEFAKIPRRPGPLKGSKKKNHQQLEPTMSERESKRLGKSRNKIGEWICQQRESRGWLQRELADRLEIHQPDVSFYEKGDHIPDTSTCIKLARVFNADVRDVLAIAAETRLARQIDEATNK